MRNLLNEVNWLLFVCRGGCLVWNSTLVNDDGQQYWHRQGKNSFLLDPAQKSRAAVDEFFNNRENHDGPENVEAYQPEQDNTE